MPATSALKRIFAANRSAGSIALEVGVKAGATRRLRAAEDGPLRVRFPGPDSANLEAMIVNTAGGIAGGDRHRIEILAGEKAQLVVTTAAAEKVYRALGPGADIGVRLRAHSLGTVCAEPNCAGCATLRQAQGAALGIVCAELVEVRSRCATLRQAQGAFAGECAPFDRLRAHFRSARPLRRPPRQWAWSRAR